MKESTTSSVETTASSSCTCRTVPRPSRGRPGPRSSDQFIQHFNDFKSSGAPSRILILKNREWVDVAHQAFDELAAAFVAGKAVVDLSADGNSCLFDFVNKTQIDVSTKAETSIAWIDVNGRCFFPGLSDESLRGFPGTEALRSDGRFYKIVEKLFLDGMRRDVPNATVTSVRKCVYSGPSGESRMRGFRSMMGMTKAARGGDANVRFGWFGGPAEVVAGVIKHGFGKTNDGDLGDAALGVGVHLSPPHFPYASSLLSDADEAGEKHMVLCRVIMGNSETVEPGSGRHHPSGDEFDSGISSLTNPKWYVVWGTHMNTHIMPEYVVSFRSSNRRQVNSPQRTLAVSGLPFQRLLAEVGRSLPASSMRALELLYIKHKSGKISREAFIKYLRSMAGDKLLTSTIKRIRGN